MKKFYIYTFGCQMNQYDSQKMAGLLRENGFEAAESALEADVVIVNTCSVRQKAEIRAFGRLHLLKNLRRKKPDLKIVVAGCTSQYHPELILNNASFVDLVLGTFNEPEIIELLKKIGQPPKIRPQVEIVSKKTRENFCRPFPLSEEKDEAYVAISFGCNNACSYCVVPLARGPEISRGLPEIIAEIKTLDFKKFPRLILLGQNVNSYSWQNLNFADLLAEVHQIEGPKIIEFLTSHPKDASDKLIQTIAQLPKISRVIHLPLQSGDNQILKLMNRGYTIEDYQKLATKIRQAIPRVKISTDIIVGFPGETEEQFQNTMKAIQEIGFCRINVTAFSPRPKTSAANLAEQLPVEVKARRLQIVLEFIRNNCPSHFFVDEKKNPRYNPLVKNDRLRQ